MSVTVTRPAATKVVCTCAETSSDRLFVTVDADGFLIVQAATDHESVSIWLTPCDTRRLGEELIIIAAEVENGQEEKED